MRLKILALAALTLGLATPAFAQEAEKTDPPPPITISGSVGVTSDYRFRGVSQSDTGLAVQGGITVTHESGVYAGFWASNLAGWGTFGGPNLELDLYGGVKFPLAGGTVDAGFTWYQYPGGARTTDFIEFYSKLSGTVGPASLTGSVYYAPPQRALGNYTNTPTSRFGDTEDNIYLAGDAAVAIAKTPITLKAHIGYSDGNPGLGPNGTSVAPTGQYADWSLGADVTYKNLTFNVSYVDTDISAAGSAYLQPNFSRGQDGTGQIANATVVVSLTAAF